MSNNPKANGLEAGKESTRMSMFPTMLITGANGYIASNILTHITPREGIFLHIRNAIVAERYRRTGWQVLEGDLTQGAVLEALPKVDCILHTVGLFRGSALDILRTNVLSTSGVLRIMETRRIPRLIFLSTAAVYGDTADTLANEDTPPNPLTPYGTSKLVAEILIRSAVDVGRIGSALVLRCGNVYGPGSPKGMFFELASKICAGLPARVDGDGLQLRDPLYIDDLVGLIVSVLASSGKKGLVIYNVSGRERCTVLHLANMIAQAAGVPYKMEFTGKPAGLPHALCLDSSKVLRELNWKPKVSLAEGIARAYAFPEGSQ
ncbi:MAG: NAD(P)-dependent oxidoreductase [bacterium]|nr:NAD(P)-dependent oxidoreductase [bacterium]